mmetsp:Transcript_114458/g.227801  ORF Transcript_114458/g.227801 Transcript_114458/m.227801 type:complete len:200 (+) Transcript_114458:1856-2455(+)
MEHGRSRNAAVAVRAQVTSNGHLLLGGPTAHNTMRDHLNYACYTLQSCEDLHCQWYIIIRWAVVPNGTLFYQRRNLFVGSAVCRVCGVARHVSARSVYFSVLLLAARSVYFPVLCLADRSVYFFVLSRAARSIHFFVLVIVLLVIVLVIILLLVITTTEVELCLVDSIAHHERFSVLVDNDAVLHVVTLHVQEIGQVTS